jgi:protein gp37
MTREDAEEFTQTVEQIASGTWRQIAWAQRQGVPEALGLTTEQWVKDRLGGYVKMAMPARQLAISELIDQGDNNVEIAKVLGVDESTVRADISGNPDLREKKSNKNNETTNDKSGNPDKPQSEMLMLPTHLGDEVPYPKPKSKSTFNPTNEHISWAAWSWNPVTGCLHGCKYCYARDLATKPSFREAYPIGFEPLFHHERLDAPHNTKVPDDAAIDPRRKRVFVCSMADLYGKWVPDEWIEQVHASCIDNPQWDYLLLTKFPRRYVGLDLPPTAWLGTSVDEQKRVRLAEQAFREIKGVRVKWLSLEPLLAPLKFTDLSMFDWVVIGSQSATDQPDGHVDEFAPPFEWVSRLVDQAREAGCRIYLKPNLIGNVGPQSPGMVLPQEEPEIAIASQEAAE